MTSREADPTSVLLFFFLPLSSSSPLCIHPIYSLKLLVNELLVRERKNWFIRDRCVLTHPHTLEWGYCSVPINLFPSHLSRSLSPSLSRPHVPSAWLSPWPSSASLCIFFRCFKVNICPSLVPAVDHSRVKLGLKTTNQDTDYVNANFIKVKVTKKSFVVQVCGNMSCEES